MKMSTLARYLAIAVLLVATTRFASANLITNPGFETGDFTGWTTTLAASGSHLFVYAGAPFGAPPHSGTYEAAFAASGPDSDTISQTFASTPGTVYDLTFWLAGSAATTTNEFLVTFGGVPVFLALNSGPFPYTELSYAVAATGSSMTLEFAGRNNNGAYYLDDVSVTAEAPVATPDSGPTWMLLGASLAAIIAIRKRLLLAA